LSCHCKGRGRGGGAGCIFGKRIGLMGHGLQ
jgi:hypothetical protein